MKRWYELQESGSVWGIRFLFWLLRAGGYRVSRLLVYLVSFYFVMFAPSVRRWCGVFHQRAIGKSSFWSSYKTLVNFSMTIVDRALIQMGKGDRFRVTVEGEEILRRYEGPEKGVFILGSHLGNLELAHTVVGQKGIRVSMLMYEQRSSALYREFERLNPQMKENLIQMHQAPVDYMLQVRERFFRGDYIGILGDRTWQSGETLEIPFFGVNHRFPLGPYQLAAVLRAPMILMTMVKQGVWDYHCYVEEFSPPVNAVGKERRRCVEQLARRFVERLEHYCRSYPLQWYNFYDFWEESE